MTEGSLADPDSAGESPRIEARLRDEIAQRTRAETERNALRRQLTAAEEAERRRLARELHDRLGQHLTALALGFEEVAAMLPPDSPALPRLAGLLRLTYLLTRDVRYLAVELHPPELEDVGLESALTTYVEQWARRYGIAADIELAGEGVPLAPIEIRTALYRILQEALTNVAKHASARQVSVILRQGDREVQLIVEDDGKGFNVEERLRQARAESRLGLAGMQERANLLGGTVSIESTDGCGTTVFARFPLPGQAADYAAR